MSTMAVKKVKNDVTCFHCGKPRHVKANYYRLIGFPPNFKFIKYKGNAGGSSSSKPTLAYQVSTIKAIAENVADDLSQITLSKEQVHKLMTLLNDQIHGTTNPNISFSPISPRPQVNVAGRCIIIGSTSKLLIDQLKVTLSSYFKLKDLGNLQYFLSLEIARSSKGIVISQRKFVLEMLEEYGLLGSKPSSIPVAVNLKMVHSDENLLANPTCYRQLIGKLMYITLTRPYISYGVQMLTQFMDKPIEVHMVAANKILKYLKNSPGQGLFLSKHSELQLVPFSNSDWADCSETKRSLTGFCVFLG
ncbi:hypothetical protein GH714_008664 [Hevea brasiliensis]|uniref:Reverse transcriptase Ty1/copia-type domain-containing protein n=1 Tax=Hevea brasiliensis TaxID=3981 RepID=A0A6A6KSU6_HEVBR|nr:hypothetical protein GH714_008664 [Hevea brasiliensis]